ncbi:MAG: sulfatase family protein [Luteolibacter sp.]
MTRLFNPWSILPCLALSMALFSAATAAGAPTGPNIIVILADDVGVGDAGCYGATKIKTPHIDRLAAEGQRFENGHASAAVCTPTRFSMLTGQYAWRHDVNGINKNVANGEAPLLIPTGMTTAPGLLKDAGYRTAIIGKWHLGFGKERPDYNGELRPGPLEVGFHEFFGIPATNDRIPTVFVRDHRVVGLDPADPIQISYKKAEAQRLGLSSFAAGRQRIGWGKGGKSAWWKDEDIAEAHTSEAIKFIERNKDHRFFLCFTPHDVHSPKVPQKRFAGASGLGERADMLLGLDDAIGQVLQTLDRLNLAKDTLILYSSDNGAYVSDEEGHRPTGPFRGIKSQSWEGGHRVPFIVRWPARIQPGVSQDLVSTLDVPATICAAAGIQPPKDALPDSFNLLPALLGEAKPLKRDYLIIQCGAGHLSVRSGSWKFIPDLAQADGWKAVKKDPSAPARPAIFDLSKDPGEKDNLLEQSPEIAKRLADHLAMAKSTPVTRPQ